MNLGAVVGVAGVIDLFYAGLEGSVVGLVEPKMDAGLVASDVIPLVEPKTDAGLGGSAAGVVVFPHERESL